MPERRCDWCASPLQERQARWCSKRCRQAGYRGRKRYDFDRAHGPGLAAGARFAYADPPYPGTARKYYRDQPNFAGEVDHAELVASLVAGDYAGWALSTSARALRDVLPMCPQGARVCAWVKPGGVPTATAGPHNRWEPLIVVGGRLLRPGVRDWLRAYPARGGGTLPGRKSVAFCAWLYELLGMVPGDVLVDLYPGTGIVSAMWGVLSRAPGGDTSPRGVHDTSSVPGCDAASPKYSETSRRSLATVTPASTTAARDVVSDVPSCSQRRPGPNDGGLFA